MRGYCSEERDKERERERLFILLNPYNSYISLELEVTVLRARYCLLR